MYRLYDISIRASCHYLSEYKIVYIHVFRKNNKFIYLFKEKLGSLAGRLHKLSLYNIIYSYIISHITLIILLNVIVNCFLNISWMLIIE